jgi:NAD(P)-dependent dehydrogenase (short-subunit alcohol dehydrogenase family)
MKPTAESVSAGIDLTGRTALVTGATSGLGRECARVLALRGARVLVACRNPDKGTKTIQELAENLGEAGERLAVRRCDLESMRSVRALAAELVAAATPIDLVLLNAGIFSQPYALTPEGHERTYAANYLGHFLLVHDLVAAGMLSPDARIVATLSEGILNPFATPDLAMIEDPQASRFSRLLASPNTKVLLALAAVELSRRVQDTPLAGVTFNGVSPRATLTDNVNQGGALMRTLGRQLGPLIMTGVDKGAAVLIWAATSPELAGVTGKVFSARLRELRLPAKCRDTKLAEQAWKATEAALGLLS